MNQMKKLIFTIALLTPMVLVAQDLEEIADSLMSNHVGGGILVIHEGQTILKKSYGYADFESRKKASPESNYRLASLTKSFIAFSVLLLEERGRLDLDDTLAKYFPEYPDYGRSITIEHLLQHLSGIPDYARLTPDSTSIQLSDENALHLLLDAREPDFQPGSQYEYSNSGYVLLGLIIELASGKTLPAFLNDEIFLPLGMNNSLMYERGTALIKERAFGHSMTEEEWVQSDQSLYSALRGDGGIYSSLNDMEKWLEALESHALLSKESYSKMYSPPASPESIYGLGWRIDEFDGQKRIRHSGSTSGFRHVLQRLPDSDSAVLILTNDNLGFNGYAEALLRMLTE